ncbi:hypothetical protein N7530_000347 [Penicillium desertorum]|uniref:Uncharacterized protein n=1 Tax=Penicillium desertorum TaxID=1303715 RepID=A0A9X0BVJ7_9EURO|nr:hypothetical protein N7530_000347 [Penicillium desertorum]
MNGSGLPPRSWTRFNSRSASDVGDVSFEASMFSREVLQIPLVIRKRREHSIVVYDYMQRVHANPCQRRTQPGDVPFLRTVGYLISVFKVLRCPRRFY